MWSKIVVVDGYEFCLIWTGSEDESGVVIQPGTDLDDINYFFALKQALLKFELILAESGAQND